jgi:hypothetical protein
MVSPVKPSAARANVSPVKASEATPKKETPGCGSGGFL